MRKFIVAGNWKMNLDKEQADNLVGRTVAEAPTKENFEIICIPPFPYLFTSAELSKTSKIKIGAQDVSSELKGAFTGEVSAPMLKDVGCQYVVVGHSERREYFSENSALLVKKIKLALEVGLKPILCCGERLEVRNNGTYKEFVGTQLKEVFSQFVDNSDFWHNITIAYEPIWAIGTGKTASSEQAQEMNQHLRTVIAEFSKNSKNISILYGGSVKPANTAELTAQPDVDGFLIGGASIDPESFLQIIKTSLEILESK